MVRSERFKTARSEHFTTDRTKRALYDRSHEVSDLLQIARRDHALLQIARQDCAVQQIARKAHYYRSLKKIARRECCTTEYGVATISRLLKIIGLFCKRSLQKRLIFSKETYNFKEPTDRSHPIAKIHIRHSGLATCSRLLKIIGLFCRISST